MENLQVELLAVAGLEGTQVVGGELFLCVGALGSLDCLIVLLISLLLLSFPLVSLDNVAAELFEADLAVESDLLLHQGRLLHLVVPGRFHPLHHLPLHLLHEVMLLHVVHLLRVYQLSQQFLVLLVFVEVLNHLLNLNVQVVLLLVLRFLLHLL